MARKRETSTLPLNVQKTVKDLRKEAQDRHMLTQNPTRSRTSTTLPPITPTPVQPSTPEEILKLLPTEELQRLVSAANAEIDARKPVPPDLRVALDAWKARNGL